MSQFPCHLEELKSMIAVAMRNLADIAERLDKNEDILNKKQETIPNRPLKENLKSGILAPSMIFENLGSEKWLSTSEAAAYLRISPKCLLNQCSSGQIRFFKFGRRNRFLEGDLRKLLTAQPRGDIYGY
jgi:excisionase family DNA binding protein